MVPPRSNPRAMKSEWLLPLRRSLSGAKARRRRLNDGFRENTANEPENWRSGGYACLWPGPAGGAADLNGRSHNAVVEPKSLWLNRACRQRPLPLSSSPPESSRSGFARLLPRCAVKIFCCSRRLDSAGQSAKMANRHLPTHHAPSQ